ncbi:MAG: adenylate cyclase [Chthoniobacter sp.]|nr:adenylate cyclase [Chthoniobacter sp.]
MNAVPPRPAQFEGELARQTLISEYRRATVLGWTLTTVLLVLLGYCAALGFRSEVLPGSGTTLLVLACGALVEWVTAAVVAYHIRTGKERGAYRAYLNATLEVALPTVTMALMARHESPLTALSSPVAYGYFLIVILSPLRLDWRTCVFTGALSAVAYGGVIAAYWPELAAQWPGSPLVMHLSFSMRCLLLILGGLAAGFVSRRIRTTLLETMHAVQERERIIDLFGQHVSPVVVNQLLSQPTGETSELRDVCVMVLDIRNFTAYSEDRGAEEVVLYLNTLWSFMVRTVNDHEGIVNKFLGDGFLAVFGAPLSSGKDCRNAIAAARQILGEVEDLATAGDLAPTQVGIALHSGQAIVGNVGSAERKEYTVIGDVVNVAFRIEALNKQFGSRLLISEPVRQAANIAGGERLPPIPIRGRRDPVELFRLD